MKPHFIGKNIKIEWNVSSEMFNVLAYQPTTPQHGWQWVWENSFATLAEAREWANEALT